VELEHVLARVEQLLGRHNEVSGPVTLVDGRATFQGFLEQAMPDEVGRVEIESSSDDANLGLVPPRGLDANLVGVSMQLVLSGLE
jgi:hypothetical protein